MKSLWKSKTFWFNVLVSAGMLFEALASSNGLIQPLVPAAWYPLVIALVGVINIWLRMATKYAIGTEEKKKPGE